MKDGNDIRRYYRLTQALAGFLFFIIFTISCSNSAADTYNAGHNYAPNENTPNYLQSSATQSSSTDSHLDSIVSWKDAHRHIGETITVSGPVVDSHWAETSNGRPTFLNIGKPYPDPDRFTVVIWVDDRAAFSAPPETYYYGKTVNVTGLVEEYKGTYEMIISSPGQILVR